MEMKAQYQARVNAALSAFLKALASAEVTELLKKEPEKIDWVSEILLDALGALTLSSIKKGLQIAMKMEADATHAVVEVAAERSHEAAFNVAAFEEVNAVIAPFFTVGKKQVSTRATTPETTQKSANVSYLKELSTQSTMIFEKLREDTLAGANDHMLVALFEAFSATLHNEDVYEKALAAKLAKFEKSGVGKLGTTKNENYKLIADVVGGETLDAFQKLETKAFWVQVLGGRRLGLYVRGHDPRGVDSTHGFGSDEARDAEFTLKGFVPKDLVEAALAIHAAQWGAPPEDHAFGVAEMCKLGTSAMGDEE